MRIWVSVCSTKLSDKIERGRTAGLQPLSLYLTVQYSTLQWMHCYNNIYMCICVYKNVARIAFLFLLIFTCLLSFTLPRFVLMWGETMQILRGRPRTSFFCYSKVRENKVNSGTSLT